MCVLCIAFILHKKAVAGNWDQNPRFPAPGAGTWWFSRLLCGWALCTCIPISAGLCLQGSPLTWNYAPLGAWDTSPGFERVNLVPLRLNNTEIHIPQVDGRLDETPRNCQCLSLLVICTPGWRERSLTVIVLGTASHCGEEQVPEWGRMPQISEVYQNRENCGKNPSFLEPYHEIGKWDPFSSKIVPSHRLHICQIGYNQTHEVGVFAVPNKYRLFVLGCC